MPDKAKTDAGAPVASRPEVEILSPLPDAGRASRSGARATGASEKKLPSGAVVEAGQPDEGTERTRVKSGDEEPVPFLTDKTNRSRLHREGGSSFVLRAQKATALAAATLRESTPWAMGMHTV